MKKIMTVICAIVLATISASAKYIRTAPFNKAQVDVEARVRVINGFRFGVDVRSTDKDKAEDIKINVENGVLTITDANGQALDNDDTTVITIICPNDIDVTTGFAYETIEKDKTTQATSDTPAWTAFNGRHAMRHNHTLRHTMPFRPMM